MGNKNKICKYWLEDLEEIKNNKYDGAKTIFIVFVSMRGPFKMNHKDLKPVHSGYYDIGDGGTVSVLYSGYLTHDELINIYLEYPDISLDDSETYAEECFEYKGWNYYDDNGNVRGEIYETIMEAETAIENWLTFGKSAYLEENYGKNYGDFNNNYANKQGIKTGLKIGDTVYVSDYISDFKTLIPTFIYDIRMEYNNIYIYFQYDGKQCKVNEDDIYKEKDKFCIELQKIA